MSSVDLLTYINESKDLLIQHWRSRVLSDPRTKRAQVLREPIATGPVQDLLVRCSANSFKQTHDLDVRGLDLSDLPEMLLEISLLKESLYDLWSDQNPSYSVQRMLLRAIDEFMAAVSRQLISTPAKGFELAMALGVLPGPALKDRGDFHSWIGRAEDTQDYLLTQEGADENQRILVQIFEESPSFIAFLSLPEFRIAKANRAYFKVVSREDVVGKLIADILPPHEAEGFLGILRNVLKTKQQFFGTDMPITITENGVPIARFIDLVFTPLFRPNGEALGVMAQGYDVTEQVLARLERERSREQLYDLLMRAPGAISVCRFHEGRLRYEFANPSYKVLVARDEISGKYLTDVFPELEDRNPELWDLLHDVAIRGESIQVHEMQISLDWTDSGKIIDRYLNITYEPVYSTSGKPDGVITFAYDATAEVLARNELELAKQELDNAGVQLQSILDATPSYITRIDANERFIFENKANSDRHGHEFRIEGKSMRELVGDEIYEEIKPFVRAALSGKTVSYEKAFPAVNSKEENTFLVTYTPERASDGSVKGFISTAVDISEIKVAEQQLKLAKDQAEEANRIKSSFLANMSHEIRTPMTAILGFTDLLITQSLSQQQTEDALRRIEGSGRSLLKLIEDVLDISKIEAGKLSIQKAIFSPEDVVQEVASVLRLSAERKGVAIRSEAQVTMPRLAYSDAARIRQILMNIIGNAVKFTSAGEVRIVIRSEENQRLIFEVIDSGIGISAEAKPHHFEPFSQGDASITRSFGGTGLGLALSRSLADKLGGSLCLAESTLGRGSRFVFSIDAAPFIYSPVPVRTKQSTEQDGSRVDTSSLMGLEILLAEDVESNQIIMRIYLETAGAKVEVANNGREAIDQAMNKDFDLVLMDMQMPVLGGAEATNILRSNGYKVPILALTAHAMAEDVVRSLQAGCNAHLTKPITALGLISAVLEYARAPV